MPVKFKGVAVIETFTPFDMAAIPGSWVQVALLQLRYVSESRKYASSAMAILIRSALARVSKAFFL